MTERVLMCRGSMKLAIGADDVAELRDVVERRAIIALLYLCGAARGLDVGESRVFHAGSRFDHVVSGSLKEIGEHGCRLVAIEGLLALIARSSADVLAEEGKACRPPPPEEACTD